MGPGNRSLYGYRIFQYVFCCLGVGWCIRLMKRKIKSLVVESPKKINAARVVTRAMERVIFK